MEDCLVLELDNHNTTAYENVNIVHVYPETVYSHASQVIAVASGPQKAGELHPLEVEVQRSLEARRQSHLSNNSVIQALPEVTQSTSSVVKTFTPLFSSGSQEQSVCLVANVKDGALEGGSEKILWLSSNSQALSFTEGPIVTSRQKDDLIDLETAQIPLTVQDCSETGGSADSKKDESCSEEEGADITPVYDDEPDPELPEPLANEDFSDMSNRCYMCFKKFRQKKNMYAHIRKIHSTQPKVMGGIVCPLCKMTALRQEHLRSHLETLHEVKVEKEERQFDSVQEFVAWKKHIEKKTLSLFISKSSPKVLAFNQTKSYYKCHRSGYYVEPEKSEKKAKKSRSQGTAKIGATCPAAMEVTENVNGVTVTYWSTHVGHEPEVQYLVMAKDDGSVLRDYLNYGSLWEDVLENGPDEHLKTVETSSQCLTNMKPEDPCPKVKVSFGRKPRKERILKSAPQSQVIDKADQLLNILRTTEVKPEFRPQICLMIDNLISTVRRRALSNDNVKKRKRMRNVSGFVNSHNSHANSHGESSDDPNSHSDSAGSNDVPSITSPSASGKRLRRSEAKNRRLK